ncbi:unnamed protein product [Zymoseptoria tritici ST99CH_1A5]|uniref:Uncharacterized protein n=3 Tax=Zymoseptoria tritici TaxID=1047171 RepID=A0A1X7S6E4_ZYMT9|nr:unnamed protein product [Zymoseptoria tritici ST99CH_3D7]SMR60464.1 unnamed protein product [Zymoseptoria tritici ST99CH_1E4]SMY28940.1 unnamed protein product [Zymoseptoria tritici ST99CH_1A5]
MRFQSIYLAFAAASFVQAQDVNSIISVLQTAIPTSVVSQVLSDPAAFLSSVESDASKGQFPSWFSALPSDVKSYLGVEASATTTGDSSEMTSSGDSEATDSSSMMTGGSGAMETGSTTSSSGGGATAASSTSSGGAAAETKVVGMGIAGAVGLVGLLVL